MGILNKLFPKKKEETISKEGKLILSMPMFKGEKAYSLESVVQDLKSYWGLNVEEITGDDETATLTVNGELVAIALMPVAIPDGEIESIFKYSYLWKEVEKEVKEHTQHAIITLLGGKSPVVEQHSILTKINASILRTCETTIGIYQGIMLLPKDLYLKFADFLMDERMPTPLWVYIGTLNNDKKSSIYTYGMKEFGKPEMEIIDAAMNGKELYYFLLPILDYVLKYDVTLKAGETIGFTEEQKIKMTESKAVYIDGNSLKLEL